MRIGDRIYKVVCEISPTGNDRLTLTSFKLKSGDSPFGCFKTAKEAWDATITDYERAVAAQQRRLDEFRDLLAQAITERRKQK